MSHARGFSLVETVITIGILTGALVALAQLVATSVHATASARDRTLATLIAHQRMERFRSEATLADGATVEHFDASGSLVCATPDPCERGVFTVHSSIAVFARAPSMVLVSVEVTHAHTGYGRVRLFAVRPRSVR